MSVYAGWEHPPSDYLIECARVSADLEKRREIEDLFRSVIAMQNEKNVRSSIRQAEALELMAAVALHNAGLAKTDD